MTGMTLADSSLNRRSQPSTEGVLVMRIAQVAPLAEAVPPRAYGGTERVISWLTEELVRRGHEVTLFASGDSVTSAELVPIVDQALWHHPEYQDFAPFWAIA